MSGELTARLHFAAALLMCTLVLAGCGGKRESTPSTSVQSGPRPAFEARLRAPNHDPRAGAPWPIVVTVTTTRGAPLRADVRYQFLFAGRVVARRSHFRFRGRLRDIVRWPRRAIGLPLTFRAVVTTALGARNLDYRVHVRP